MTTIRALLERAQQYFPAEIAGILEEVSPRVVAVEDHWASRITDTILSGLREAILWIGGGHGGGREEAVYEGLRDDGIRGR
ncbi:MAG: hypothetical protein OXI46_08750 [Gemmatimonadota bacterium]|nr:hypothetical protein [Boseongicola sp.]MDE2773777.1 hypothetical protein [Gemmatimonadota bacterium]